ncbi:MAG TPA: DUF29 domain-containing protein [Caulobacterales bacterium]|nr:DUF29 domain-containing protein [Caulobacterales bacterium]
MAHDHRPQDLYEQDFYLWTLSQAQALRARGKGDAAVEWDKLAEEVEDMGKSERRESFSRTATIIEHLFKLAWSGQSTPRAGWRSTIRTQRRELALTLTPTLRRQIEAGLEKLHCDVALDVADTFETEEPAAARDVSLRWTLPQILGEADDPIA